MTSEGRAVIVFETDIKGIHTTEQFIEEYTKNPSVFVKIGSMTHWQSKQYSEKRKGNGKEYLTLPKTEYASLSPSKPKRHRRTKAEMAAARGLDKVAS